MQNKNKQMKLMCGNCNVPWIIQRKRPLTMATYLLLYHVSQSIYRIALSAENKIITICETRTVRTLQNAKRYFLRDKRYRHKHYISPLLLDNGFPMFIINQIVLDSKPC